MIMMIITLPGKIILVSKTMAIIGHTTSPYFWWWWLCRGQSNKLFGCPPKESWSRIPLIASREYA